MKYKLNFLVLILIILISNSIKTQNDSLWSVMLLKKGNKPEIKNNMALFSQTGFYLYRNCLYDIELKDNSKLTLQLVDIKQDTMFFLDVGTNSFYNLGYQNIKNLLLIKDWETNKSKKINCEDYYFIFSKSIVEHKFDSRFEKLDANSDIETELIPRLSNSGISYHYKNNDKMYFYSEIKVNAPRFSDEQIRIAFDAALIILDILINVGLNSTSGSHSSPRTIRKR